MKKGKILVVALVGLLMVSGLVFVGCDDKGCPGDSAACKYDSKYSCGARGCPATNGYLGCDC